MDIRLTQSREEVQRILDESDGLRKEVEERMSKNAEDISKNAEDISKNAEDINNQPFEKGSADNSAVLKGGDNSADGQNAVAIGSGSNAGGKSSFASGNSVASGDFSHSEGAISSSGSERYTKAIGRASHAEGEGCHASSNGAHAEGIDTDAKMKASHAEGNNTQANAQFSHSEGTETIAGGNASHAEGNKTIANGSSSHAEGLQTITTNTGEHACGKFNKSTEGSTMFSVGIGESDTKRRNAFEIDVDGNIYYANGTSNKILQNELKTYYISRDKFENNTCTIPISDRKDFINVKKIVLYEPSNNVYQQQAKQFILCEDNVNDSIGYNILLFRCINDGIIEELYYSSLMYILQYSSYPIASKVDWNNWDVKDKSYIANKTHGVRPTFFDVSKYDEVIDAGNGYEIYKYINLYPEFGENTLVRVETAYNEYTWVNIKVTNNKTYIPRYSYTNGDTYHDGDAIWKEFDETDTLAVYIQTFDINRLRNTLIADYEFEDGILYRLSGVYLPKTVAFKSYVNEKVQSLETRIKELEDIIQQITIKVEE